MNVRVFILIGCAVTSLACGSTSADPDEAGGAGQGGSSNGSVKGTGGSAGAINASGSGGSDGVSGAAGNPGGGETSGGRGGSSGAGGAQGTCTSSADAAACLACCDALYPGARKDAFFGNECLYCTESCRETMICTDSSDINGPCLKCAQSYLRESNCRFGSGPGCPSLIECLKQCPTN